MLPPHRGNERPSRVWEIEPIAVAKAPEEPAMDDQGRVILKSTLRVLEPVVRQAKLVVVK